jgi:hypothetical protein
MAKDRGCSVCHYRFVLVAEIECNPWSFGKDLQAYVNHHMCVANDVAAAGKEQIHVTA